MDIPSVFTATIFPVLAPELAALLAKAPARLLAGISEIRLRSGRPLLLVAGSGDVFLGPAGLPVKTWSEGYLCTPGDIAQTLQLISKNSLYAFEEELRLGFITIAGGHRVGLAGQAIVKAGELIALKNISALNIRIARELRGVADKVMPYLLAGDGRVHSTLVISPPRCGKTTLLRDIARQLSCGVPALGFGGIQVGVVDERSEIAASQAGVPTADLGPRADVLDCCPKSAGMLMLIRSMAPQAIVTDELGREADAVAVREALHAGVSVVASVHGSDLADIAGRPYIGGLIGEKRFARYIILSARPCAGTVTEIAGGRGEILYQAGKEVRICG